jgi:PhzF family phenazine biosynthesis protein
MKLRYYQVDAFTDQLFHGNPAGVCPLDAWLPAETMQSIAAENNQAETSFYCRGSARREIRWFTPAAEVDLCGHGTLAAAHVIFTNEDAGDELELDSRSGVLRVTRRGDRLTLDFPVDTPSPATASEDIVAALGRRPREAYQGRTDLMLVYRSEQEIAAMAPDFGCLAQTPHRGVIVTAPATASAVDFVSRFFAPQIGINEDPVTGSAHTTLVPYWSARLGKRQLEARQLSRRGGELSCTLDGERVLISGRARTYLTGSIELDR